MTGIAAQAAWPYPGVATVHALVSALGAAGQPLAQQESAVRAFTQTPAWQLAPGVLQRDVRRWLFLIYQSEQTTELSSTDDDASYDDTGIEIRSHGKPPAQLAAAAQRFTWAPGEIEFSAIGMAGGGWADAWRHEARGKGGKWVKNGTAAAAQDAAKAARPDYSAVKADLDNLAGYMQTRGNRYLQAMGGHLQRSTVPYLDETNPSLFDQSAKAAAENLRAYGEMAEENEGSLAWAQADPEGRVNSAAFRSLASRVTRAHTAFKKKSGTSTPKAKGAAKGAAEGEEAGPPNWTVLGSGSVSKDKGMTVTHPVYGQGRLTRVTGTKGLPKMPKNSFFGPEFPEGWDDPLKDPGAPVPTAHVTFAGGKQMTFRYVNPAEMMHAQSSAEPSAGFQRSAGITIPPGLTKGMYYAPPVPELNGDQSSITGAEWGSISAYVSPKGNKVIASYLRNGTSGSDYDDVTAQGSVAEIDSAMSKLSLAHDTVLYRGIALTPSLAQKIKPGAAFTDKDYTSVSSSTDWADTFAHLRANGTAEGISAQVEAVGGTPLRMEMHVPAGTHVALGEGDLGEYILPRGSAFHVNSLADGKADVTVTPPQAGASLSGIATQALELGWRDEARDSRGRWTMFGGVGEAVDVMEKEREGFSVSPRTGESPAGGYMVALEGHTHRYPAAILDDPAKLHKAIDDMLMSERKSFQGHDMFLGGWVEDGKLWLDPSQDVQDRATAERLGRERDQVGIFDLNTFSTIGTGGSGGGHITDHQFASEQGPRECPGELLGPAGGRAPGRGGEDRRRHQGGIAAQLDLAGWHDAWRHELRDAHGRWARDPAAAAAEAGGEAYPGAFSDEVQKAWRGETDPTAKDSLNKASAYLDDNDKKDAAFYLHKAQAYANLAGAHDRALRYSDLAEKILGDEKGQEAAAKAVHGYMASASPVVPSFFGTHETLDWDGKEPTVYADSEHPSYLAYVDWDGHVNVNRTTADAIKSGLSGTGPVENPAAFTVPLHELIHVVLPPGEKRSSNGDKDMYQKPAGQAIEEGFTELATIHNAAEFFDKIGVGDRETLVAAVDSNGHLIPNPDFTRKQDALVAALRSTWDHLMKAGPGSLPAANAINNAIYDVQNENFSDAVSEIRTLQHTGNGDDWEQALRMKRQVADLIATGDTAHATMREYAERLAQPDRIRKGDSWGHYTSWTASAYDWTAEISRRLTGKEDPATVKKLADQVSAVGTAAKPRVMAEQLLAASHLMEEKTLTRAETAQALASAQDQILASWGKNAAAQIADNASRRMRGAVAGMRGEAVAA